MECRRLANRQQTLRRSNVGITAPKTNNGGASSNNRAAVFYLSFPQKRESKTRRIIMPPYLAK
ncbi:MAG: hypothetical protein ACR2P4_01245 [Gammaproteobacteria bacterium]